MTKKEKILFSYIANIIDDERPSDVFIETSQDISKLLNSFLDITGILSLILEEIAKQIGKSISVVEVFITHMLIKKEIPIKAPIRLVAESFITEITLKASLL